MKNLFQKHKLLVGGVFVLIIIIVTDMFIQNQMKKNFSTPELIEIAFVTGRISEEQRLLYLAYANYEYESLPTRFLGNFEWDGTSTAHELYEAVSSPTTLCSLSPYVRSELLRLIMKRDDDTACN